MSADGTRRVYTRRARILLAALVLVMASVCALGLGSEIAVTDVAVGRVVGFGILALGLLTAHRLMRMAIVVTPGRVTLRGLWRTRMLSAGDVVRFEPPPPYGMGTLRHSGLRVVLTDGGAVSAGVFEVGQIDGPSVGVAECAELNHWLRFQGGLDGSAIRVPASTTD
ncbi:hypothetical protein [Blastococcus sp. TF02-09]|uniref:hypothetical protein n=1 Tax=Blastococcus sp. TF02-09 TaxID=2250576 RepID=UPI0011BE2232|nr:hypothetical protein [Blastococcus sp. TF02-9]